MDAPPPRVTCPVDEGQARRLRAYVHDEVHSGRLPFLGLCVARCSRIVFESHVDGTGHGGFDGDTILRIYSMTKVITSVAALMLVDQGRLSLEDPISRHLDWRDDIVRVFCSEGEGEPARRNITVRHLLTHTAGFTYQFSLPGLDQYAEVKALYRANRVGVDDISLQEIKEMAGGDADCRDTLSAFVSRLNEIPLIAQPGTVFEYSVATDVLGAVIESVTSMTLGEFLKEAIFDPLEMKSTGFSLTKAQAASMTPCYSFVAKGEWERAPVPAVSVLVGGGRDQAAGGGGGLFSTTNDYMKFAMCLCRRTALPGGGSLLKRQTFDLMREDHLALLGADCSAKIIASYSGRFGLAGASASGECALPGGAATGEGTLAWYDVSYSHAMSSSRQHTHSHASTESIFTSTRQQGRRGRHVFLL